MQSFTLCEKSNMSIRPLVSHNESYFKHDVDWEKQNSQYHLTVFGYHFSLIISFAIYVKFYTKHSFLFDLCYHDCLLSSVYCPQFCLRMDNGLLEINFVCLTSDLLTTNVSIQSLITCCLFTIQMQMLNTAVSSENLLHWYT